MRIEYETIHVHSQMPQARAIAEQVRGMIPHACALTSEAFPVDTEEASDLAFSY